MKAKYIYTIMMAMALTFGMASCDDDDNNNNEQQKPATKTELKCDVDTIEVGVGEAATFNILEGGGDYKLICENEDIAKATVEGNSVTVNAFTNGFTGVVISDAEGNYKRVVIKAMYFEIFVASTDVTVFMKLGHDAGYGDINILGGNGNYKVDIEDLQVVKLKSIKGSVITLQAVKVGETTCTITDALGLTKTINVKVETTTVPFSEAELEMVRNLNSNTFNWDSYDGYSWATYACEAIEGGKTKAYWDYYQWRWQSCTWTGDASVGKKGKGVFHDQVYNSEDFDVDVEILKNDGSRVWGVCSGIKNDYLYVGYFCVPLK